MYTGVRRMCGTKQPIRPTEDTRMKVSVVNARDRLALETNTTRDLVGRGPVVSTRQASRHDVCHDAPEGVESGAAEMAPGRKKACKPSASAKIACEPTTCTRDPSTTPLPHVT